MVLPLINSRIRLSQGQIFWREIGQGPALVFLHGSCNDSSQWVPVIDRLSRDYHCFAPDLLGFGDSERPNTHYSIDLEVECLAEFLKTLNLRQVYLVGHSLGGWVASSYALKYPEQVRGVMLLAPEGLPNKRVRRQGWWTRWLMKRPPMVVWLLRSLHYLTKILPQKQVRLLVAHWQQMLQYPTTCQLLFQRHPAEITAELLHERLEWLRVPVFILQGEQDTPTAIAQSKTYADLTPTAQLHFIDGGGNNLPQELPDAVAKYICNFIDRVQF